MSIEALLRPRSLALVGLSERNYFGPNLFGAIERSGYAGQVFPVNPNRTELFGRKCYPSLAALPERPDSAVLLVPNTAVLRVLGECRDAGVRAAVIVGSGFAEIPDPAGAALQRAVAEFAQEAGIAICGPNCNGIINARDGLPCFVGPLYHLPQRGNIGLISQSGATIGSIVTEATDRNLGFTFLISSGNEAQLDAVNYLEYLLQDDETRIIAGFLESLHRPAAFLDLAKRAAEAGKPLVVVKIGRSARGRESAAAHTGSLAGSDQAYEAAFRHWGVTRADDVGDLLDKCQLLSQLEPARWPRGRRLAFMSVSGGGAGLLADLAEARQVELPEISPKIREQFKEASPPHATVKNPLDFTGQIHAYRGLFQQYVEGFTADPAFDGLGVLLHCEQDYEYYLRQISELSAGLDKPIILTAAEATAVSQWGRSFMAEHPLPVVLGIGRFLTAFAAAADYRRFRERDVVEQPAPADRVPRALDLPAEGGIVPDPVAYRLLDAYGLPVAATRFARTAEEAAAAAEAIGYPVALKAVAPGLGHKSDVGGVALGLASAAEVAAGFAGLADRVAARLGRAPEGTLVQQMVTDGVEAFVGAVRSEEFGPIVVAGLGGVFVEVLKDVSVRLAPVDASRAEEMLGELKGARLLDGVRGRPAADRAALVETIVQVSQLAADLGDRLSELDFNPVMVRPVGKGVRIVDALLVVR